MYSAETSVGSCEAFPRLLAAQCSDNAIRYVCMRWDWFCISMDGHDLHDLHLTMCFILAFIRRVYNIAPLEELLCILSPPTSPATSVSPSTPSVDALPLTDAPPIAGASSHSPVESQGGDSASAMRLQQLHELRGHSSGVWKIRCSFYHARTEGGGISRRVTLPNGRPTSHSYGTKAMRCCHGESYCK